MGYNLRNIIAKKKVFTYCDRKFPKLFKNRKSAFFGNYILRNSRFFVKFVSLKFKDQLKQFTK